MTPAMKPTTNPAAVATNGLTLLTSRTAAVAPPDVKLPSTVRSGKPRMRKVR